MLNYLRHGKLVLDHGLSEEGLREEAEFYNLPKLIALCNERIADREKQKKAGVSFLFINNKKIPPDQARLPRAAMPRGRADQRDLGNVGWLEI